MSIENIGSIICRLRKEKGVTQEELSKHVGVSMQAVSKWECGGVPDVELIPKIADYFQVSTDVLFNRDNSYIDFETKLGEKTDNIKNEKEKLDTMFFYNWVMHLGVIREDAYRDAKGLYEEARQQSGPTIYSRHLNFNDNGITFFNLSKEAPYFYLFPGSDKRTEVLLSDTDYCGFFSDLSDEAFFKCIIFLYKRDYNIRFTPDLLIKELEITEEQVEKYLQLLKKYKLLSTEVLKLNDSEMTTYRFEPSPSIIGFLTFAQEILHPPGRFFMNNGRPVSPFL